jgi:hypothetical protein
MVRGLFPSSPKRPSFSFGINDSRNPNPTDLFNPKFKVQTRRISLTLKGFGERGRNRTFNLLFFDQ